MIKCWKACILSQHHMGCQVLMQQTVAANSMFMSISSLASVGVA